MHDLSNKYFLVYQGMKVASQTIEHTIKARCPEAEVERCHWLTPQTLSAFKNTSDFLSGEGEVFESFRQQVINAEIACEKVQQEKPVIVIAGFRDPLDHAISAFFQNLAFFCPTLSYEGSAIEIETRRVEDVFRSEFVGMLDRLTTATPAKTMREHLADLKLGGIHRWFRQEFNAFFGFDVYQLNIGDADMVRYTLRQFDLTIYRFETLRPTLPDLMRWLQLPDSDRADPIYNIGAEKRYGRLYARFRETFQPTAEMVDYYYGAQHWGPYFSHFYQGAVPWHERPNRRIPA